MIRARRCSQLVEQSPKFWARRRSRTLSRGVSVGTGIDPLPVPGDRRTRPRQRVKSRPKKTVIRACGGSSHLFAQIQPLFGKLVIRFTSCRSPLNLIENSSYARPSFRRPYLAAVYDAWHPRSVREDYDFYLSRILTADAVLDVGCGTGTLLHEARLAGHSGRLCGIDPAPGVLNRARMRTDIEWVLGDLQSAGWTAQFDLIVMTGHAFQALVSDEDLRGFMAAVRHALVPGGCFAFETRNPSVRAWENWTPENAVVVELPDRSSVQIATEVVIPFDGKTLTFTHRFCGKHRSLPRVSQSTLRFLEADELSNLLENAGLRIEQRFGGFDGSPLGPLSPEIITLATR
ncbi:methylase involved in ubiquinone/menaquinone biosynthesis [Rhizobium leguminosarum bv. trifolii WSM2012]|nr:methylase involved in ubiquinone/menaquinone biosynthesis [Rhizobium leguminosarum bv. trifolii WSM2012]